MVDAAVSKTAAERREGSTPSLATTTMKINVLRYLTTDDPHDYTSNWSRRYEWEYGYRACNGAGTILNAACGTNHLHASFAKRLCEQGTVYNCDMSSPVIEGLFDNFFLQDILQPLPMKYDVILCISTVEDFLDPVLIKRAIVNLLAHTKRRLIITADIYDKVRPEWFSNALGLPDSWDFGSDQLLTGATSSWSQHEFSHLRVLVMDIDNG